VSRPDDIRDSASDAYWADFESRWTGLLSYRYLGRAHRGFDRQATAEGPDTMRLRHDMRNASGGLMAAPLCIAAPEAGGFSDVDAVPNPVIASLHIVDPGYGVDAIEIVRDTVKTGRTMGFSRTRIVDAADPRRLLALSEGMGVDIGPAPPGGFAAVDNPPITVVDSPDLPPLHRVFGAVRGTDAVWSLPELSDDLASPDAALHLGPIHVLAEAAASDAAEALAGAPLQIVAWHVMFLARGKRGPFLVDTDPAIAPGHDQVGVRWTIRDVGNGDRPVTSGSALIRRVDK
jgi:hypothetical protein